MVQKCNVAITTTVLSGGHRLRSLFYPLFYHVSTPGVDVMITIFCEFSQFSALKIGVFLKYQCYDQIFFQNLALFWAKNGNFFAKFIGKNILKIITSVPGVALWLQGDDSGQVRLAEGVRSWQQGPLCHPHHQVARSNSPLLRHRSQGDKLCLLLWVVFREIRWSCKNNLGTFFTVKVINWSKDVFGYILGNFFKNASGTDVMIFKIFLQKNSVKKLAFLTPNKAKLFKNLIITLVFEKNAIFLPKNSKNCRKLWS
jgi:hypothetical protein